ncbi:tetratricopeptide repeat protein [Streptomyces sp. S1D4-11]
MSALDRLSAQALAALNVTAWLGPGGIPRELLPAPDDAAGVQSELLGRGLLVEHPDGGCALPEVIRRQVREAFGDQGRDHALMAMRDFLGAPGSPGETARCVALVPHLTYWTSQTRAEDDFVDGALVLNRVVVLLLENKMGAVAVPLAERFARTCELHIGPRKPVTLIAESNLAAAYDQAGEHVRGARRLEKVADACAAAFGPDDPSVWDAYNNLGGIYMAAGEYDRAAGIVERIITHRTATLGPDHRATLMARNNLAVIRDRASRTDEAIALWREMLPEFEAALGTGDTDTLAIRSALFRALRRHHGTKGPRDPSEIEAIVARLSENSGEGTQQTVAALVERATLLRDQGRLEEAEAAFLEAIEKGLAHARQRASRRRLRAVPHRSRPRGTGPHLPRARGRRGGAGRGGPQPGADASRDTHGSRLRSGVPPTPGPARRSPDNVGGTTRRCHRGPRFLPPLGPRPGRPPRRPRPEATPLGLASSSPRPTSRCIGRAAT